jgi:hypothetical protein
MKRLRICAAWLAIVALLIDGLLPTAATAAVSGAPGLAALCGAATGGPVPAKPLPVLPTRHCALCAAFFTGLLPNRPDGLAKRLLAGAVRAEIRRTAAIAARLGDYPASQPRAPPRAV